MSNETTLTVVGNLTGDPELAYIGDGVAVVRFTVASTPRRYDRDSNIWQDAETLFVRCVAWRHLAEHVAESMGKGHRVVVAGRLHATSWETDDGQKRTGVELVADEAGPSLLYATTRITSTSRRGSETGPDETADGGDAPPS